MDVMYFAAGSRNYVDVTVRHPRAQKYRGRAARADGAAARIAEAAKRVRYPANAQAGLLEVQPFAIETFGRLGPGALKLLRSARQRVVEADQTLRGWAGVALFNRWLSLLSVALQRSLFESAQAAWGRPDQGSLLGDCLPFAG